MTVKDVLKITALLIGRSDVTDYLEGNTETPGADALASVNTMTSLCNLVVNELAGTYIPLVKTQTVNVTDKKLYYSDLSESALKILSVCDGQGKSVDYVFHHEYIVVGVSPVTVDYEYTPSNLGLEDLTGYMEKDVPARVLAYGVAAEFAITEGCFDEAVMWHKRYVDALSDICLPKNVQIRKRRWA